MQAITYSQIRNEQLDETVRVINKELKDHFSNSDEPVRIHAKKIIVDQVISAYQMGWRIEHIDTDWEGNQILEFSPRVYADVP